MATGSTRTIELVPQAAHVDFHWKAVRRLWAAVAIALFPVLLILDELYDYAFSPVLPGLIVLAIIWAGFPYLHMELLARFSKRPADTMRRNERARRHESRSRYGLGVAVAWVLLWLVLA